MWADCLRARLVGALVSKVAEMFSVLRSTVSKIYSAYLKVEKHYLLNHGADESVC